MPRMRRRFKRHTHQNRMAIEFNIQPQNSTVSNLELLFARLYGRGETFAGINLVGELWALDTAPWTVDFFLISVPVDIDPNEVVSSANETIARDVANDALDISRLRKQAEMHLVSDVEVGDQWHHPNDVTDPNDLRTYFDSFYPRQIHHKQHCLVPIVNATVDADVMDPTFKTFIRKPIHIREYTNYSYARPSVLMLFYRQLLHDTNVTGPWTTGAGDLSESQWRALLDPQWREVDDGDPSTIDVQTPYIRPQDAKLESDTGKVLNGILLGNLYSLTNNPQAKRVL